MLQLCRLRDRMDADDAELDVQAQVMAEKALAALPEGVRAAKMPKVKEGILKRLKAQAAKAAPPQPAGAPPATAYYPGYDAQSAPAMLGGMGQPPPPPDPPPEGHPGATVAVTKLEGVELCGDEAWFGDHGFRFGLREAVRAGHAEQKILVGPPADEIRRICPGAGRILGAGAVLRLGGATLGGYGEPDIAYAYRQLSRALHPDKNRDVPEAHDAFQRLAEAADELRAGLTEARGVLSSLCATMSMQTTPETMERPQEALFAEATRVLYAILGLSGEGQVPPTALNRGVAAFTASRTFGQCQAQVLLTEWYDQPRMIEFYAGTQIRTAYDCSKKKLRAQFLCALNRGTLAEAKRHNDCVRGNWQAVMMQFPEIGLWREFHDKLKVRVWSRSKEEKDADKKERGSMWDDDEGPRPSLWAKKWRGRICAVLPRGMDLAAPFTDPDVRQMCAALWRDIAEWARTPECGCDRHLSLFTAEPPAPGTPEGETPNEWAFVPAADILLIVGESLVGITAEGVFVENKPGHDRMSWADALEDKWEKKEKKRARNKEKDDDNDKDEDDPKDKDGEKKSRRGDKEKPENDPNFDWEQVWRTRVAQNKHRRGGRGGSPEPSRGDKPRRRSRSRERRRSRSRGRRREPSKEKKRSRSKRPKKGATSISS